MPILSVIIPLKTWENERLVLLANSLKYVSKQHDIEIIIIYSADNPTNLFIQNNINIDNVKFIYSEPKGIYNAFNLGAKNAKGDWVMFFGGDDLLLPSISNLLTEININDQKYSAIVCNVAFGYSGVFRPFKHKFGLIFKNWCQQGVLYNKKIFSTLSFDEKYPIQADHKFNIEVASKLDDEIKYSKNIIAYFNTSGISQSVHDYAFRNDMPSIVSQNFGFIWGALCRLRRSLGTIKRKIKG